MIAKSILMYGQPCILCCDGNCRKAWGINNRPQIYLDDPEQKVYPDTDGNRQPQAKLKDVDNNVYLADHELGEAPIDPGTYEGDEAKPKSLEERLNKWCARECERHVIVDDNEDFFLPDFSQRRYNIAPHYRHIDEKT